MTRDALLTLPSARYELGRREDAIKIAWELLDPHRPHTVSDELNAGVRSPLVDELRVVGDEENLPFSVFDSITYRTQPRLDLVE